MNNSVFTDSYINSPHTHCLLSNKKLLFFRTTKTNDLHYVLMRFLINLKDASWFLPFRGHFSKTQWHNGIFFFPEIFPFQYVFVIMETRFLVCGNAPENFAVYSLNVRLFPCRRDFYVCLVGEMRKTLMMDEKRE